MSIQNQIEDLKKQITALELSSDNMALELSSDNSLDTTHTHPWANQYVIVRSNMGGSYLGILKSFYHQERIVYLEEAIRLWRWQAFTLSEAAMEGVGPESKVAVLVPNIMVADVIELIPATSIAVEKIKKISPYKPKYS